MIIFIAHGEVICLSALCSHIKRLILQQHVTYSSVSKKASGKSLAFFYFFILGHYPVIFSPTFFSSLDWFLNVPFVTETVERPALMLTECFCCSGFAGGMDEDKISVSFPSDLKNNPQDNLDNYTTPLSRPIKEEIAELSQFISASPLCTCLLQSANQTTLSSSQLHSPVLSALAVFKPQLHTHSLPDCSRCLHQTLQRFSAW